MVHSGKGLNILGKKPELGQQLRGNSLTSTFSSFLYNSKFNAVSFLYRLTPNLRDTSQPEVQLYKSAPDDFTTMSILCYNMEGFDVVFFQKIFRFSNPIYRWFSLNNWSLYVCSKLQRTSQKLLMTWFWSSDSCTHLPFVAT